MFAFILISALLAASGTNLIVELGNSLNSLFTKSKAPHFVQMHSGKIDQTKIDRWSKANKLVKKQQTVKMITIDGSSLFLGDNQPPEKDSIMDISFVKQNLSFDFLLNLKNEIIQINSGEIAVPIYFMKQNRMKIGDKVRINNQTFDKTFTITAFLRDAQMNPSIVHSKRFLINESDFTTLEKHFSEKEYLIEFLLNDIKELENFSKAYLSSGLPKKGPSIDYNLFKTLNSLTDGIVAGAVIILGLLLMIIAILCLRFTILATIEEDYKEIGVMKAIGLAEYHIRRIYLSKYIAMGFLASLLGYLTSLRLSQLLSSNILLYIGSAQKSLVQHSVPLISATAVSLIVIFSSNLVLRRFNRITAVEALRSGNTGEAIKMGKLFKIKNSKVPDVNIFLGFKDVFQRFRMFGLLCFVFFFCSFLIIVPVNFLTTIESPHFIRYMGIGKSDIRIDLRHSDNIIKRFEMMINHIEKDADIKRYSPMVTSRYTMLNEHGKPENINIETGDFSLFPLDYLIGKAPLNNNEIALSYLNSKEMEKSVGDILVVLIKGEEKKLIVSGIYQDVTNGGRTAKAVVEYDHNNVLWYTISLNTKPNVNIKDKVSDYSKVFYPSRITELKGYLNQTLGNTIEQIRKVTVVAVVISIIISVLIISLFLKMLIAKDSDQIAIMKSLGLSLNNIRVQYLTKALLLLGLGIISGTIFSNTLGQSIISVLWSFMGASQIRFIINPVQVYLFVPVLLMLAVSITTIISIRGIKNISTIDMIEK